MGGAGLWIICAAGNDGDFRSKLTELANAAAHLREVPLTFTSQSVTRMSLSFCAVILQRDVDHKVPE